MRKSVVKKKKISKRARLKKKIKELRPKTFSDPALMAYSHFQGH